MGRRRDLRTRFGRCFAVGDAVTCRECRLTARARYVLLTIAYLALERVPITLAALCEATQFQARTARKYLAVLESACGEDVIQFVTDVVDGRRAAAEWVRALELHGGRHGA